MLLTGLYKLPIGLSPAIIAVFACLLLAACSQTTKTAQNASSAPTTAAPVSPTASPTPEIEQLKVPERVASGAVTESGGAWNKAVQSIKPRSDGSTAREKRVKIKKQKPTLRTRMVVAKSCAAA